MHKKQQQYLARQLRNEQTLAEKLLWQKLRKRSIGGLRVLRQVIIRYEEAMGRTGFFIVDFLVTERKLVIELDGSVHINQVRYDQARDALLRHLGYTVIRFTNAEVYFHIDEVIRKINADLL